MNLNTYIVIAYIWGAMLVMGEAPSLEKVLFYPTQPLGSQGKPVGPTPNGFCASMMKVCKPKL